MRFFLFFLFCSALHAAPVLHQIRPDSNFTQITTLEACSFMVGRADSVECNPALFPFQSQRGVAFSAASVTDGDSVDNAKNLLFSKIKKEDVQLLFQKRAFSSLDGNTSIKFMTPYFFLYYRPLTVTADLFVYNPSFPEISMALIKNKQLGISSGIKLLDNDVVRMSLGANLYHFQRRQYIGSFSLVDLTSSNVEDLIQFQGQSGLASDLGFYLQPKSSYLPTLSFLVKNIGSKFYNRDRDVRSENRLRPLLVYEMYSRLGLSYRYDFKYGGLGIEANAPFQDVYSSYLKDYTSLSLAYFLGGFEISGSVSKYQRLLGLKFSSKSVSTGVFYGNNQSLGDYYRRIENVAGVQVQVSL